MNKYYVPDISEFYVGFEYEKRLSSGKFKPKTAIAFDLKKIQDSLKRYNEFLESDYGKSSEHDFPPPFRVKHLDKDDIESLGFKLKGDDDYFSTSNGKTYNIYVAKNKIEIYAPNVCFIGDIKNKSELKKVLEMIGYNN